MDRARRAVRAAPRQQAISRLGPRQRGRGGAEELVISTDGAVSGRRAACAAVIATDGRVIVEAARSLRGLQGYALAAEVAAVALAARLAEGVLEAGEAVTLELDNPSVPRVIDGSYRPPRLQRIPRDALATARAFCDRYRVTFRVRRRNATWGLRRADRLAGQRLWAHRRARRPRA